MHLLRKSALQASAELDMAALVLPRLRLLHMNVEVALPGMDLSPLLLSLQELQLTNYGRRHRLDCEQTALQPWLHSICEASLRPLRDLAALIVEVTDP